MQGIVTSGINLVVNALFLNPLILFFGAFSPQLKSHPQTPTPLFSVRKSAASCHTWGPQVARQRLRPITPPHGASLFTVRYLLCVPWLNLDLFLDDNNLSTRHTIVTLFV